MIISHGYELVSGKIRGRERRRFPRVALRRILTYESGFSLKRGHYLEGKRFRGYLLNISNEGICFRARHRPQKRMVLRVNLPISEVSPAAPTLAQVMWVRRDAKSKQYHTGLRFII